MRRPLAFAVVLSLAVACRSRDETQAKPPAAATPVVLRVAYGSEKRAWLEEQLGSFALAHGFRPANTGVPIGAPVDTAHGVDARQPQTLLELPAGEVLDGLLHRFRGAKKPSNVLLVFEYADQSAAELQARLLSLRQRVGARR